MDMQTYQDTGIMTPDIRTSAYSSPMHNFQGAIMMLTNPEDDLYRMELTLKGLTIDKDGNVRRGGTRLLNDEGVNSMVGIARSIISQNTNMSNLEEKNISMIMVEQLGDAVIQDLMVNADKYEIDRKTSNEVRNRILTIVSNTSYITLKRALEQGERRFWKGSQQEITTRVEGMPNSQSKSGGMGGLIKGLFK